MQHSEEESMYFDAEKQYLKDQEERMYSPSNEESTDFGEVPHKEYKGSIARSGIPYNYGSGLGVTY